MSSGGGGPAPQPAQQPANAVPLKTAEEALYARWLLDRQSPTFASPEVLVDRFRFDTAILEAAYNRTVNPRANPADKEAVETFLKNWDAVHNAVNSLRDAAAVERLRSYLQSEFLLIWEWVVHRKGPTYRIPDTPTFVSIRREFLVYCALQLVDGDLYNSWLATKDISWQAYQTVDKGEFDRVHAIFRDPAQAALMGDVARTKLMWTAEFAMQSAQSQQQQSQQQQSQQPQQLQQLQQPQPPQPQQPQQQQTQQTQQPVWQENYGQWLASNGQFADVMNDTVLKDVYQYEVNILENVAATLIDVNHRVDDEQVNTFLQNWWLIYPRPFAADANSVIGIIQSYFREERLYFRTWLQLHAAPNFKISTFDEYRNLDIWFIHDDYVSRNPDKTLPLGIDAWLAANGILWSSFYYALGPAFGTVTSAIVKYFERGGSEARAYFNNELIPKVNEWRRHANDTWDKIYTWANDEESQPTAADVDVDEPRDGAAVRPQQAPPQAQQHLSVDSAPHIIPQPAPVSTSPQPQPQVQVQAPVPTAQVLVPMAPVAQTSPPPQVQPQTQAPAPTFAVQAAESAAAWVQEQAARTAHEKYEAQLMRDLAQVEQVRAQTRELLAREERKARELQEAKFAEIRQAHLRDIQAARAQSAVVAPASQPAPANAQMDVQPPVAPQPQPAGMPQAGAGGGPRVGLGVGGTAAKQPSKRKAASFAMIAVGENCDRGGCVTAISREHCTIDNVGALNCDLRTLKVPPFYAPDYGTVPGYEAFAHLSPARQMLLHLVNARKMIQRAAPILTVCTPFVCDAHLLYPNPVAFDGSILTLFTGTPPPEAGARPYVSFIPAFSLEDVIALYGSKQPLRILHDVIDDMRCCFGNNNVKHHTAAPPVVTARLLDATRHVSNPYLPLCVPPEAYAGTRFANLVRDAGNQRILNEPIFTAYDEATKQPTIGPWGQKLIPEKYHNEHLKYYRMGKGYLLSAFEHLRAAAIIFGTVQDLSVDLEYAHLTPEQYNMLYWAFATIAIAMRAKPVYGPAGDPESHNHKVFKGRILKFEDMTDFTVYHMFAELLVRYAVAETTKTTFTRNYDAQKSVRHDNVAKLVRIHVQARSRVLEDDAQLFALVKDNA